MSNNALTYIALAIACAAAAASAYLYQQNQRLIEVTNLQGQAIMLLLETPQIQNVVNQQLERRKEAAQ